MVVGVITTFYLRQWGDYGVKLGLTKDYDDFLNFFFDFTCVFIAYFPLLNLAVLMSAEYATVNLKKYHSRRLTRLLEDEYIFEGNDENKYDRILCDE